MARNRHGVGIVGRAPRGGHVKYIVILVGIIALVTYVFLAGPKVVTGASPGYVDRRQLVWDRISQLESRRRSMLVRAEIPFGPGSGSRSRPRGVYGAGYNEGFKQGYFEGSFLAESRKPNPLFFPIPNP